MARSGVVIGLVVAVCLACSSGLREDEIGCEEAAAHLAECCARVDASMFDCGFSQGACGRSEPEISVLTSTCVRNKACGELESQGICDEARGGRVSQCS